MNKLYDCHECCVCAYGNTTCPAIYNNLSFTPAAVKEIVKRLDLNEFPDDRAYMIDFLKSEYRYRYTEEAPTTMSKAKMLGAPTKYIPNNKARGYRHKKPHEKFLPETAPQPIKKLPETKHPVCRFNEGVVCVTYDHKHYVINTAPACDRCGWNPAVQKARSERLSAKPGRKA